MPNRIARDSARSSRKLASVSAEVERLFWRLLLVADDFGRFDADPAVVLSTAFPRQAQALKVKSVSGWLRDGAKAGLWILYRCGEDEIGQMYKWEQRVRANRSKFPPSDDGHMTVICQSSAGPDEDRGSRGKDEDRGYGRRAVLVTEYPDDFAEFWKAYPRRTKKPDAFAAWKQTEPVRPPLPDLLRHVKAARDSADWRKEGGKFIPYPASWLRGRRWEDEPIQPKKKLTELLDEMGEPNAADW